MKVYRRSRAGLTGRCRSETSTACCAVVYCGGGQSVSFNTMYTTSTYTKYTTYTTYTTTVCVHDAPRQQDALVLLQLLHEGRVGLGDSTSLLHVVEGRVQIPAVLLHGVGDDRGGGAAHAHLTVDQTLHTGFSRRRERESFTTCTVVGWRGAQKSVQTLTWLW